MILFVAQVTSSSGLFMLSSFVGPLSFVCVVFSQFVVAAPSLLVGSYACIIVCMLGLGACISEREAAVKSPIGDAHSSEVMKQGILTNPKSSIFGKEHLTSLRRKRNLVCATFQMDPTCSGWIVIYTRTLARLHTDLLACSVLFSNQPGRRTSSN